MSHHKLGRLPIKRDHRTLTLSKYTRMLALAPPPVSCPPPNLQWPMNLNDRISDCTIAGAAHCIELWSAAINTPKVLSDDQVLTAYEQLSGYNQAVQGSDNGCYMINVLNTWSTSGIASDTLAGFVALNITDLNEIKDAINWFGCAYIGLNLPESADQNVNLWDVVPGSPISGGHCVIIVGYDEQLFYIVSWGMLIPATPAFISTYMEEAYALLSKDFINVTGTTPQGIDWTNLQTDISQIRTS